MDDNQKPSVFQIMSSVLSAAFGVQSTARRERDFTGGTAAPFIIAGIVFTVLFILTIIGVVKLILN